MNAQGRRLDAWLIYKCAHCDTTWNLPLVERAAVSAIADEDLRAMQTSAPAWVRERAFDLAALRRYCDRVALSPDVTVAKRIDGDWPERWSAIELAIEVPRRSGQRLDRLLAGELGLPRAELRAMLSAGGLNLDTGSGKRFKKPVSGSVTLRFVASRLTERQRSAICKNVSDRRDGPP